MTLKQKIHFLLLLILGLICHTVSAVEKDEIRVRAALDLFPSILAADMGIEDKTGPDGSLLLVLLYTDNKEKASEMAEYLRKVDQIRGIPIRIEISDERFLYQKGDQFEKQTPAGIFLTQSLSNNIDSIITYGREKQIIVFSPFEGDVERGVLGGIHISERLLPYINMSTLQSSNIRIKSFFLRIARCHE